eukprot:jgi/Psemu1/35541/gm1.35541_g
MHPSEIFCVLALICLVAVIAIVVSFANGNTGDSCFDLNKLGIIKTDFNPAFLSFEEYDDEGEKKALVITSFYNIEFQLFGSDGPPPQPIPLESDLVARVVVDEDRSFDPETVGDVEILTDTKNSTSSGPPKIVWPNEATIAPDGVFPFEAKVIAQGFLGTESAGRISAIELATGEEYIITQSIGLGNESRFYHHSVFHDMDGDGLLDIVSVRSGKRIFPLPEPPVSGELVWFKNPGENLDKTVPWEETILVDGLGPDIAIQKYDFDDDGVPEFLTAHFFTGEKIVVYGVSGDEGEDWSSVAKGETEIRSVDISTDQGKPFDLKIEDLNGDGYVDILATNHQEDDCQFPTEVPGRVYAITPPKDKQHFFDASKWTERVLLDNIYPQPSLPGARASRLTPGKVSTFYPSRREERIKGRPWIVVGGDEAGKVWIFKPKGQRGWNYEVKVIFDINDEYGPDTTQSNLETRPGISISTIGAIATRYDRKGDDGMTEIYIPVFEGQEIHVFSFRKALKGQSTQVKCLADIKLECPAPVSGDGGPPGIVPKSAGIKFDP